jgi:predicted O-methyltransferase YrrM
LPARYRPAGGALTLAAVTQDRWNAVDDYLTGLLLPPDAALDAALRATAGEGIPGMQVSPAQGALLHLLARTSGARAVLEIGTLAAYSTIWLARALPPAGRLVTLEADPRHAAVARRNLAAAGLAETVELIEGPALATLPHLNGPFDLFFLDAHKQHNPEYLAHAVRLAAPRALIIADNTVRDGEIANETSDDPTIHALRRFHEQLGREPHITSTAIQTVGVKGYDGLTIALLDRPAG